MLWISVNFMPVTIILLHRTGYSTTKCFSLQPLIPEFSWFKYRLMLVHIWIILWCMIKSSILNSKFHYLWIAAKFLNLPSPVPFSSLKEGEMPSNGVNFAYGGSGLFFTYGPEYINISVQIDQFEKLSNGKHIDYQNSLVLFVYGGNDYSVHLHNYGPRVGMFVIYMIKVHKNNNGKYALKPMKTRLEIEGIFSRVNMTIAKLVTQKHGSLRYLEWVKPFKSANLFKITEPYFKIFDFLSKKISNLKLKISL